MRAGLAPARRAWGRGGAGGRGVLGAFCVVAGLATVLAACGGTSSTSGAGGGPANTSTVTFAMEPGGLASYPFPFMTLANASADSVFNVNDFQYLLYRPLYWFGEGTTPYLNTTLSLAYPPTYQGHQVTIRLKSYYKWSNGEPVDAQDVVFWMNMMTAEGSQGIYYSPTGLPADVSHVKAASKFVVTMDITSAKFSEPWFTNNELSEITPMPMAWDRTATGPSDCITTISACTAVYNYLNAQSTLSPSTFGASPIWGVVDGPWKIQSLNSLGKLTVVFNKQYSGPVAPRHITTFIEVPFTSEQAEYNVLQDPTGSQIIDVGYLPTVDAPVPPAGASVGANPSSLPDYTLSSVYAWQLSYFPYNFKNDTGQAPIFDQLYFRQAFQSLVDQEGVIAGPLHGYGKPTIGPVGDYPLTKYLSPTLERLGDQWTLNIGYARQLLASHGWAPNSAGIDTCVHPGGGPADCGPKIPSGAQLKFNLIYPTGLDWMESSVRELASNASLVGIQVSLSAEPFNQVTGTAFGQFGESWQLAEWGSWTYAPDYLPTGDELFETNAPNNAGQYSNARNDALIAATLDARTSSEFYTAMYNWQDYLAGQLPVVYVPDSPTLMETIDGLNIGPQNSASTITPEDWYYLK